MTGPKWRPSAVMALTAAAVVIPAWPWASSTARAGRPQRTSSPAPSIRVASTGSGTSQPALHVIPFPNTPDAAPRSHIIFSSLRPSDLSGSPLVTGSSSGPHTGRLIALPDHAGTAFVPAQQFTPGERVSVHASLTSTRAGTASGDPGSRSLSFSFTVALPAPGQTTARTLTAQATSFQPGPFHSQPQLDPPRVHVDSRPAPGPMDIFLSPRSSDSHSAVQSGLMILNPRGQLVWFKPVPAERPYNLEVQRYEGRPVLTWWQGVLTPDTTADGQDVILNTSYRRLAVLHAAYGYSSDVHEFQITPQGTALIDAYVPVQVNLSSVGGPSAGWLDDCVIQELDIRTGQILWEWHALGHVPLSASRAAGTSGDPYAYFHLNSIQQLPDHRLLISSRDTWSVYLINELTGRVIWTLGGKYSSFAMGPGTRFEWQHDAHLYGPGLLTLFDDGASPQEERQSSAKELAINFHTHRVSLVARFTHSPPLLAGIEGSAELLADHDVFVGWGSEPDFSQYTPRGRQVFNATFPLGVTSYRAYRFAWSARPRTPPTLALARPSTSRTWLYVSWNGATQVADWRVLGGQTRGTLKPLETKRWSGFETAIDLSSAPRFLAAQAMDSHGHPLGRSKIAARPAPAHSASLPAAHGQPRLHVIPFPNTPDAAPQSQIIFSALQPSDLAGNPLVTGSSSGPHRGHLVRLPDRAGTAFVPAKPFTSGEKVVVQAFLNSPQAGTASGDPGATRLTFSFTVAVAPTGTASAPAGSRAHEAGPRPGPFRSAPELNPPRVHVDSGPAPGAADIFLSPHVGPRLHLQSGLMILNPRGRLVWFHPTDPDSAFDFEVQRYQGRPVLTWWQGLLSDHHVFSSEDVIFSDAYKPVAQVRAAYGYLDDLHDFQITPQGTALIEANPTVQYSLSSVGGPADARVVDGVVQELDIRTGRILWEWHALGHIPLGDSYEGLPPSGGLWDPFHLNSIQQLSGHRLLISFRNTWSVCLINELTGRVIWTVGGKNSTFSMGRETNFEWQHDAHLNDHGLLTLFDDAAVPQEEFQSSAKELMINSRTRRVSLVAKFTHSPPLLAGAEGSAQLLRKGDMFVGWGDTTNFSQYTRAGQQIFNATFPLGTSTYRVYRLAWTGRPLTRPAVALSHGSKGVTWAYVSWNGATQVTRWRVLGGPSPSTLTPLKAKRWTGFETSIALPGAPRYLAVQALDAQGHVLGRSKIGIRPTG